MDQKQDQFIYVEEAKIEGQMKTEKKLKLAS